MSDDSKSEMEKHYEQQSIEAFNILKKTPHLLEFIKNFNGDNGFMFSGNTEIYKIGKILDFQGHSGCSFALTLRQIQTLINNNPEMVPFDAWN